MNEEMKNFQCLQRVYIAPLTVQFIHMHFLRKVAMQQNVNNWKYIFGFWRALIKSIYLYF